MYIHLASKSLFLCHPRTGSRTTSKFLQRAGFQRLGFTKHEKGLGRDEVPFTLANSGTQHHERLAASAPAGWSVACTVRDHVEVVTSWLFSLQFGRALKRGSGVEAAQARTDFDDFLKRLHSRERMGAEFYPEPNSLLPNLQFAHRILFYETLLEDLRSWLTDRGIEFDREAPLPIEGDRPRNGMPALEALRPEWIAAICDRYRDEMADWKFLERWEVAPKLGDAAEETSRASHVVDS